MKTDMLGMGSVAIDLVLRCDELPKEDGFSFVHEEKRVPGGSASNLLTAFAAMGGNCAIIAKTGSDDYGKEIKTDLEESGVSTEYLVTKEGGTTMHTIVAVADNGSRSIFANLGDSFLTLSEDEVNESFLDNISIFYTDMFNGKPSLKLARACAERSIPVVFNLQCALPFMKLCGVSIEELEEMISLSTLFLSGKEGLSGFTPYNDPVKAASYIYEKHKPRDGVITTLGEDGVFLTCKRESITVPAFTVNTIDTTGAGDSFGGGLIFAYYLKNYDIKTSLEFANACGAIKCTQNGPRLKSSEADVLDFINANKIIK